MDEVDPPVNNRVKKTTKITLSSATTTGMMNESDSGYSVTSESPPENTEAGPDIAENEEFLCASEAFKDPNAFDFLSNRGVPSNPSSLLVNRESLYVKFDPLVAGRPSVIAANKDLIAMNSPSPPRNNIQVREDSSAQEETLSQEQIQGFQESLAKKELKLKECQTNKQKKLEEIENIKVEMEKRKDSEEQMKKVLEEYEKTIGELIAEKEKEKRKFEEEVANLIRERDQAAEDLRNVETAFADVHRKYERSKQVVEGFKQNEDALKRYIEDYKIKLKKQEQKYDLLKAHAEETLEKANLEIENITKAQNSEIARISALLRKTEMKTSSLEKIVDQKVKENEELANICDELISKVSR
ncbi:transforming acidic coiled-coil-containing protein 3 [Lepeophtheirus salmonis]|uniref:Putative LOC578030 [Strongylocentrotus purpuratus] n=1 Tax=Lepeophtheirus salmonis TaxID=72036 RepID=A0A0K2UQ23_LEPSM|nr:transforming acidic coiled-coil-containing protein 3-like [Lepeophtheirus salmonis]